MEADAQANVVMTTETNIKTITSTAICPFVFNAKHMAVFMLREESLVANVDRKKSVEDHKKCGGAKENF